MKITKARLKQLIKEELDEVNEVGPGLARHGSQRFGLDSAPKPNNMRNVYARLLKLQRVLQAEHSDPEDVYMQRMDAESMVDDLVAVVAGMAGEDTGEAL